MNKIFFLIFAIVFCLKGVSAQQVVNLHLTKKASRAEQIAADDFCTLFQKLYPDIKCVIGNDEANYNIIIGTKSVLKKYAKYAESTSKAEGFSVKKLNSTTLLILGNDTRGVCYGMYRYLKRIGVVYTLDEDIANEKDGKFSFENIEFESVPSTNHRPILNWHNLLSGSTAWDLQKWKRYVAQSHKLGVNELIVHSYGNSALVDWEYKGFQKENEPYPSSKYEAGWGINGINDVRQMYGGELYNQNKDYFGSDVSELSAREQTKAYIALTQEIFDYAAERGMNINFMFDLASPDLMPKGFENYKTKESNAFFKDKSGKNIFPNVSTEEGKDYVASFMKTILNRFPQITDISITMREIRNKPNFRSAIQKFDYNQYPEGWKREFEDMLPKLKELKSNVTGLKIDVEKSYPLLVLSKTIETVRKSTKKYYKKDIKWHCGSWHFTWLGIVNEFISKDISFMPFDYDGSFFENPRDLNNVKYVCETGRKVTPLYWPQNDDGRYLGRSFTPSKAAFERIDQAKVDGFGILHWMTHPYDLWFCYNEDYLWSESTGNTLPRYIRTYVENVFGKSNTEPLVLYFNSWIKDAPHFARDTRACMMDIKNKKFLDYNYDELKISSTQRLKWLKSLNIDLFSQKQKNKIQYFKHLEVFSITFLEQYFKQEKVRKLIERGKIEEAKNLMHTIDEVALIQHYIDALHNYHTEGELGVLVSLNSSWLPFVLSTRVVLGQAPYRINFTETENYNHMTYGEGQLSVTFDEDRNIWYNYGSKESQSKISNTTLIDFISKDGIVVDNYGLTLEIMLPLDDNFPKGDYEISLNWINNSEKSIDVEIIINNQKSISIIKKGQTISKQLFKNDDNGTIKIQLKSKNSIILTSSEIGKIK